VLPTAGRAAGIATLCDNSRQITAAGKLDRRSAGDVQAANCAPSEAANIGCVCGVLLTCNCRSVRVSNAVRESLIASSILISAFCYPIH
jgi:hypothetical protein